MDSPRKVILYERQNGNENSYRGKRGNRNTIKREIIKSTFGIEPIIDLLENLSDMKYQKKSHNLISVIITKDKNTGLLSHF